MFRFKFFIFFALIILLSSCSKDVVKENTIKERDHILIQKTEVSGKYVRQNGLDFKKGDVLIKSGTRLNFRNIALIAAMNIPWIKVTKKPRIAVFSSGSELVYPGDEIGPDQIISSNSLGLSALIEASRFLAIVSEVRDEAIISGESYLLYVDDAQRHYYFEGTRDASTTSAGDDLFKRRMLQQGLEFFRLILLINI